MSRTATRWTGLLARDAGRLASVLLGALLVSAGVTTPEAAEALRYGLEIHDRQAASYELELPVGQTGTLIVDVEWSGRRTLAFRVEGPGSPAVKFRRAGPSPQRLEVEVTEQELGDGEPWKLFIHSLPDRGEIEGVLTVRLPSPRSSEPEPPRRSAARTDPAPPAEPWLLPDVTPRDAGETATRIFETSEALRAWIVSVEGIPRSDACGWQGELLEYLSRRRADLRGGDAPVGEDTSRFLARVAEVVELVEALRSSDDPFVIGPVPADELKRRAWLSVRQRRVEPIEQALDSLHVMLRRDFTPELSNETWPQRLIGCLTACERYFEQRVRLGEARAPNATLAVDQWNGILAAADALDALASVDADASIAAGESSRNP